jgi:Zn-dependent peptidase ImmA (M78 family)
MTSNLIGIQPSVLRWAREAQGYSIDDVALHLKREPDEIEAWESGESAPSYSQLEKLAYNLYKRPLAVFFLPEPPKEPDVKQEFRTLPDVELDQLAADTRYQLRLAHALQISLLELNDERNSAERLIFRDIKLTTNTKLSKAAKEIRTYLKITLDEQSSWKTADTALKAWRNVIEETGIYVFKHSFKQKSISGFCLSHTEFPVIYLNNSTTKTRQIFSLFHELAHLLLNQSSITKVDTSYIAQLPKKEQGIEKFCNALAAEILMPESDFGKRLLGVKSIDEVLVSSLARRYRVSREVVLRRILDKGLVSKEFYETKSKQWADEIEAGGAGGDYYATQASYLGDHYLSLVFSRHYQGRLSLEQAADYLGVRTKSIAGLEELFLRKAAPS